jgi:hypothetical protein
LAANANLHVATNRAGEMALDARGVPIADVLQALAEEAGFEVSIAEARSRPPVNLSVPMAPVEAVLQEMLRGRNYALVYDGDDVSQVILLPPSGASPARSSRPAPPPPRGRAGGKAAPAALVIRN